MVINLRELAKWVCGVGKVSKDPEQETAGGNRGADTRADGYPDIQEKDISKVRSFKSDRQIQLFLSVGGGRRSGLERMS